jgi:SNF2 family DNA or RNA helicase
MKFPSSEPQDLLTQHLLDHEHALGFVGVGIGKTAATLSALNKLFHQKKTIGALVLAPMRVANLTWPLEVERWDDFKWMKVANLRSPAGKRAFLRNQAHIYVCNYESIPKLVELVKTRKSMGLGLPFDLTIIDESTKLKNPTSKRANLYRREVTHDQHKRIWALTGTPAPNSLLDLFAQARFVDNGKRLGRAFEHFKQTYFKQTGYGGYKWKELPGSNEAIENRLADITLTLRSKDWLNLPETVVEDVEVKLPPNLVHDYKEFEKELVLQLKSAEITAPNAAALVAKLLQFTSGSIYDADSKWHDIHDLKIKALEKIIKQTDGPVLVACAFRHEQERLRKAFPQAKFFADAKNQTSQKQLLEDWNNKKIPVLVAHPKSVGHGLNLQHGGNTLVWMTLTYSREDYEQMIARLDRRGQDTVVTVYRLMVPDTVDFAVATVIEEKKVTEDRLLTALQLLESYREGTAAKKPLTIKHEEDFC